MWKNLDVKGRNISIKGFKNTGNFKFFLESKHKKWINPISFIGITMFDYFGMSKIMTNVKNDKNEVIIQCESFNYTKKKITSSSQNLLNCTHYSINGLLQFTSSSIHSGSADIRIYENKKLVASTIYADGVDYIETNFVYQFGDEYKLFESIFLYSKDVNSNGENILLEIVRVSGDLRELGGYYNTSEINLKKPINSVVITIDNK